MTKMGILSIQHLGLAGKFASEETLRAGLPRSVKVKKRRVKIGEESGYPKVD